jgi:hypothetical protein
MIDRFVAWFVRKYILPEMDRQIIAELEEYGVEFIPDPAFDHGSSTKH